jgi:DNA-directed RNA polymerase subunit F
MTKPVYIMSIEASDLYSHMERESYIKRDYVGMIPYSLELIQLHKKGLEVFLSKKHPNKHLSNDVINVKFKQKVKSGKRLLQENQERMNNTEDEEYRNKLSAYINSVDLEWEEVSASSLRKRLYTEGFTIKNSDGTEAKYVVYKRSSAKSRTGQCLFIKESLHDEMINWSRMGLSLEEGMKIDLAGLLAYESLVGSSIEDTIEINPESILIVPDVKSTFKEVCNVVRTGEYGYLDSFEEEIEITNEIFDGEALLDSNLFKQGQSMMLLRNHMFKAASFATNLQLFFQDYFGDEYESKYIEDMFGNPLKATDIKMIITPSCLKALKFSHAIGTDEDMWDWWKQTVKSDGSIFGICKHEKATRRGSVEGKPLQQTSYQMLNSLPASKGDIEVLSQFERDYIIKLKNNDDAFIEYISQETNDVNANEMFVKLYNQNNEFVRTKVFREFRSKAISDYVRYIKKGKIRLIGDYAVLFGNPVEYLYHAVGESVTESIALKGNQVYTKMFEFNQELTAFRNPHTSQSNVLVVNNTYNEQIERYFNLTDNIAVVNSIKFNLLNILSGSDFDSDTIVLFQNEHLSKLAKECYGKYNICVNEVSSTKKDYKLTTQDMYQIDNQLADSQRFIGEVVNVGQLALSLYWDKLNRGIPAEDKQMKDLLKKVDVMTVLSGVCIDLAKKFYDIEIGKEIKHVRSSLELKVNDRNITTKPNFWRFVSDNESTKYGQYNCPMDYLYQVMNEIQRADEKNPLEFSQLLIERNKEQSNRKQRQKIKLLVNEMYTDVSKIMSRGGKKKEVRNKVEDSTNEYLAKIGKLKVKPETMYNTLREIDEDSSNIAIKLLNVMYRTQQETFLNAFK